MSRLIRVLAALVLICLVIILYAAYWFTPAEDRTYESRYLKSITSSFLTTDDFKIHYTHAGKGDPLILIHGGGTWLYSYRHNLPTLSQKFSVYALDMPGHGYTVPLGKTPRYDFETMSRILLEFMNRQRIEKAILVGHSWGGSWTIYFTYKHPERVKKLILIGSSGLNVPDILTWELLKYPIIGELISKFFTTDDVKRGLESIFFHKELVTSEMIQEIRTPLTFIVNRKAQYLFKRNLNMKLTERAMSQIRTPTLIIWGANDEQLPVELSKRFKELIPNAELIVLDDCGHAAHEEYPDKVNQLIIDFLMDN